MIRRKSLVDPALWFLHHNIPHCKVDLLCFYSFSWVIPNDLQEASGV